MKTAVTYHESVQEAITQALLLLMKQLPYEEISVSAIVHKAGVSCSSFYRSYLDKDDVLEKYADRLFSQSKQIEDPYSEKNLRQTIVTHYEQYYENREFLQTLHRNRILFRFMDMMRDITEETISDSRMTVNVCQAGFFSAANLGVLVQWLERNCQETPQEIADIFITLLFKTPRIEAQ